MTFAVPLVAALMIALTRENADVIAPWIVRRAARGVPAEQHTEVKREWLAADLYYESENKPLTRIFAALWLTVAAGSLRAAYLRRTTVAAGTAGAHRLRTWLLVMRIAIGIVDVNRIAIVIGFVSVIGGLYGIVIGIGIASSTGIEIVFGGVLCGVIAGVIGSSSIVSFVINSNSDKDIDINSALSAAAALRHEILRELAELQA